LEDLRIGVAPIYRWNYCPGHLQSYRRSAPCTLLDRDIIAVYLAAGLYGLEDGFEVDALFQ